MLAAGKTTGKIYGPETVIKKGIAYPNKYWADLGVVPAKNPDYKAGSKAPEWIHPDRLAARNNTSKAVKGGLDNISDKAKHMKAGYQNGKFAYDLNNSAYNPITRKMVNKGNALGRFRAGIKGALLGAGKASFLKILRDVLSEHDPGNKRISDILDSHAKPGSFKPSKELGEVASPEYVAQAFEEAMNKKKGNLLKNIAKSLGKVTTKAGRASIRAKMIGTAEGIARGIASSDIGQAAYNAGKKALETVTKGVSNALEHIVAIFDKKKAAELQEKENTYHPKVVKLA